MTTTGIESRQQTPAATRAQRHPWVAALAWAVALSLYFFLVYDLCTWLTLVRDQRNPAGVGTLFFAWERKLPFVPWMIFPYWSIDALFFFAPFVCRDHGERQAHGKRVLCALTIAGACFVLFPLKMGAGFVHPPVEGASGFLFRLLGGFDRPYNLAPSLHIAFWSLLWIVYARRAGRRFRFVLGAWFVLIAVSTVLTWQHHVVDVAAGLGLGMLCFYLFPDRAQPALKYPQARIQP